MGNLILNRRKILLNEPHIQTVSGDLCDFKTDVPGKIKSCIVRFEPMQEGTGDPSTENVRNITGYTGCKLTRTGRNMLGGSLLQESLKYALPNSTDYPADRYFQFTSGATTAHSFTVYSGLTRLVAGSTTSIFKPKTSYTMLFTIYKTGGTGSNIAYYLVDSSTLYGTTAVSSAETKQLTRTVTSASNTLLQITKRNSSRATRFYYDESGVFEGDVPATEFEPYKGTSIDADWSSSVGTAYGGYIDLISGQMVLTKELVTITGGLSSGQAAYSRYPFASNDYASDVDSASNIYPFYSGTTASLPVGYIRIVKSSSSYGKTSYIALHLTSDTASTAAARRDYDNAKLAELANNGTPLQVLYSLVTPKVYQLDPVTLSALRGQNYVWNTIGATEVSYYTH